MRYTVFPACSGSTTSWKCPENLRRKVPRKHPDQMPPQLAPFNAKEQRLYSELPLDVWVPYFISKGEPSHSLMKPTEPHHLQRAEKQVPKLLSSKNTPAITAHCHGCCERQWNENLRAYNFKLCAQKDNQSGFFSAVITISDRPTLQYHCSCYNNWHVRCKNCSQ